MTELEFKIKLLHLLWALWLVNKGRNPYFSYLLLFMTYGHSHVIHNGFSSDLRRCNILVKEGKW